MVHRILLIAQRDYLQAVLSKAYLFGLIFVPLLIGGSFLGTSLLNRSKSQDQRIAIIDRTGVSSAAVIQPPRKPLIRQQIPLAGFNWCRASCLKPSSPSQMIALSSWPSAIGFAAVNFS